MSLATDGPSYPNPPIDTLTAAKARVAGTRLPRDGYRLPTGRTWSAVSDPLPPEEERYPGLTDEYIRQAQARVMRVWAEDSTSQHWAPNTFTVAITDLGPGVQAMTVEMGCAPLWWQMPGYLRWREEVEAHVRALRGEGE